MKRILLILIVIAITGTLMAMPLPSKEVGLKMFQKIDSFRMNNTRLQNPVSVDVEEMEDGQWALSGKVFFEYANNKLTSAIQKMYVVGPNGPVFIDYVRYNYNYSNSLLTSVTVEMNAGIMIDPFGPPVWITMMQFGYTYNAQNHLTDFVMSNTDYETGVVSVMARVHYQYDNNRLQTIYSSDLDEETSIWTYEKQNVSYHTSGKVNEIIGYTSADSVQWTQNSKSVLTYDPSDTSNYDTFQYVIDNSNYLAVLYSYPFNNARVTAETSYLWEANAWVNDGMDTYEFDANWNVTSDKEKSWINNSWVTQDQIDMTYVSAQQVNQEVHSSFENEVQQFSTRYVYSYSTATDNHVVNPSGIKIESYPNPFTGNTTISVKADSKTAKVQLFNIKGRLIAEEDMNLTRSNTVNFKTDQLSSGIYFVKVKTDTEVKTSKIMKLK